MPWRNSVLFPVVLFPGLAVLALASLLFFSALPWHQRPSFLLPGAILISCAALGGALLFAIRLRRRLDDLSAFLKAVPTRNYSPSLPVWDEDEIGVLERGLQELVARQYDRMRDLQAERKKLEVVLQSMAEGVVVIDPLGHVVLCNRAAQDLFGMRSFNEWQGKPLQAFSRHPVLQELLREVSHRRPDEAPITREIEIEGREERHLAISAMQIWENDLTVSGYVLVFYDLTQLKQLESVRSDFVANVSHELRTPLTAIKGYSETLLNGALKDPDTAQRFLAIIDRHSERLSRLIDDLLTLSNLELGKTELRRDEIPLSEMVDEVFEVIREKAAKGGVTLQQTCPPDLPLVIGDSDRMQQVLLNLVDNAIKYTPAKGTVTVSARQVARSEIVTRNTKVPAGGQEEWLEVAVSDTGCGIPAEDLPRLTQRFYRVDKTRSRELGGTGLGLAIVKHIVNNHNGFLQIESQLQVGTTVRLFFPPERYCPMSRIVHWRVGQYR
jgi:two-component system phosphate regulon sensor histidine kinase PhoR